MERARALYGRAAPRCVCRWQQFCCRWQQFWEPVRWSATPPRTRKARQQNEAAGRQAEETDPRGSLRRSHVVKDNDAGWVGAVVFVRRDVHLDGHVGVGLRRQQRRRRRRQQPAQWPYGAAPRHRRCVAPTAANDTPASGYRTASCPASSTRHCPTSSCDSSSSSSSSSTFARPGKPPRATAC